MTATAMAAGGAMGLPGAALFGAFNTVQLISMQTYHGGNMPANAASFLTSIDQFMKGSALNPSKLMENILSDEEESSTPVMMRQL